MDIRTHYIGNKYVELICEYDNTTIKTGILNNNEIVEIKNNLINIAEELQEFINENLNT